MQKLFNYRYQSISPCFLKKGQQMGSEGFSVPVCQYWQHLPELSSRSTKQVWPLGKNWGPYLTGPTILRDITHQIVEILSKYITVCFLSLSAKAGLSLPPFGISCSWRPSLVFTQRRYVNPCQNGPFGAPMQNGQHFWMSLQCLPSSWSKNCKFFGFTFLELMIKLMKIMLLYILYCPHTSTMWLQGSFNPWPS